MRDGRSNSGDWKQELANEGGEIFGSKGLRLERRDAGQEGTLSKRGIVVRRNHDDGNASQRDGVVVPQTPHELQSIDARHVEVRDNQVYSSVRHQGERLVGRRGLEHVEAAVVRVVERTAQQAAHEQTVVDDEDSLRH